MQTILKLKKNHLLNYELVSRFNGAFANRNQIKLTYFFSKSSRTEGDPHAGISYLQTLLKNMGSNELKLLMALEQIELEDFTSAQQNLDSYLEKLKVNFTTIFELSVLKWSNCF